MGSEIIHINQKLSEFHIALQCLGYGQNRTTFVMIGFNQSHYRDGHKESVP